MNLDQAIAELSGFSARCTAIMDLIGGGTLHREKKVQAQDLLRALKEDLKARCKEFERQERQASLDGLELAFVGPALRQARVHLGVATNTIPGEKWRDCLDVARGDIDHQLHQLKDQTVGK